MDMQYWSTTHATNRDFPQMRTLSAAIITRTQDRKHSKYGKLNRYRNVNLKYNPITLTLILNANELAE